MQLKMVDHFMFAILSKLKQTLKKNQLYREKKKKIVCTIFLLNVLGQNFSELSIFLAENCMFQNLILLWKLPA